MIADLEGTSRKIRGTINLRKTKTMCLGHPPIIMKGTKTESVKKYVYLNQLITLRKEVKDIEAERRRLEWVASGRHTS